MLRILSSIFLKIYLILPTFLDVHSIGTLTEDGLIKEQNAPRDEQGAKTVNILYNFEVGSIYCIWMHRVSMELKNIMIK
jgi:hypothetical protein